MEGEDGQVSGGPPKMIKAKDLPGAVNVLPTGLGDVLKKRASREIKMEQKGSSMTVSSEGHQQTFSNFQAESKAASSTSTFASSATSSSSANFANTQQTSASFMQQQQQQQSSISSSFSSSSSTTTQQQSQVKKSILKQPKQLTQHGEEIQQESLKSTIQSAITDIEHNLDRTDFADKENVAPSQQQQEQEMLRLQQQEQELLRQQEQELLRQQQEEQLRIQQEEQLRIQQQNAEQLRIQQEEQLRIQQQNAEQSATETNSTQNGHFNASDLLRLHDEQRAKLRTPHEFKARPQTCNLEELYTPQELDLPDPTTGKKVQTVHQQEYSVQQESMTTVNGSSHLEEESRKQQMFEKTIGDGITLGKVMTPVQDPAYDTSSLKRRNPRQMFTDSAFYSPKFHPSVAEQVEMAHKLSSSLFEDNNKNSKGHDMFLKRAKKSGDTMEFEPEIPKHDKTPNLKLVMNPEGKLHDWQDLPEEEVPEMDDLVNTGNPEVAHTLGMMVQNLNEEKGRGKVSFTPIGAQQGAPQQFKATPSFAGGFRQVFDTRRGMFEQSVIGTRPHNTTCTTPRLARSKTLPDIPQIIEEPTLKRPHPSPLVPKRSSSKQMVAMMEQDSNRRPLRSFFSNA